MALKLPLELERTHPLHEDLRDLEIFSEKIHDEFSDLPRVNKLEICGLKSFRDKSADSVLCFRHITITLQQVSRAVLKKCQPTWQSLFTMLHFVVLENLWLPLMVVMGSLQPAQT